MHFKNRKDTWTTRQNRVKYGSDQPKSSTIVKKSKNHRQIITEIRKILKERVKTCSKSENTHKNRKDTQGTLQKSYIFAKILYWSLGKLLKILNFHERSPNLHCKNRKDTWATRQNHVKIGIRSTKIVENRQKVGKSQKNHHRNSKDTQGTRQNVLQI